ncbi:MAG: TadE family protein [Desulfitobacteriaceae bacterium]
MFKELERKENGQALVEMALILPLLLVLIFGSIEIGRICFVSITINNAARIGARSASVGEDDSMIRKAIEDSIILNKSALTIQISPSANQRYSGGGVTVNVSYPVQLIAPLINRIIPNPFIVDAGFTMRLE